MFADNVTKRLVLKEKEKHEIYKAMLNSSHHIINNALNQMSIMKIAAKRADNFDNKALDAYENIVSEAQELLSKLENINEISKYTITQAVAPQ